MWRVLRNFRIFRFFGYWCNSVLDLLVCVVVVFGVRSRMVFGMVIIVRGFGFYFFDFGFW